MPLTSTLPLTLEPRTFFFFMFIFCAVMGFLALNTSRTLSRNIKGLDDWAKALGCYSLCFLAFFTRGYAHAFFSNFGANLGIIVGSAYAVVAHCKYFGTRIPKSALMLFLLVCITGDLIWYLANLPNYVISLIVSGPCALAFGYVAMLIVRHSGRQLKMASNLLSLATTVALALGCASRVIKVLMHDGASVDLYGKSNTQISFLIIAFLTSVSVSMGLILMSNDRHKNDIYENSRRDGLTGLFTRTAFFENVAAVGVPPGGEMYSVIMLDIDHFKKINDKYGHAIGDLAIIHASRVIARSIRAIDVAGRYGGEEFCILLQQTTKQQAGVIAQKLVDDVRSQSLRLPDGVELKFTISAGYACLADVSTEHANDAISNLLEVADQALYRAKNGGRNRAEAA